MINLNRIICFFVGHTYGDHCNRCGLRYGLPEYKNPPSPPIYEKDLANKKNIDDFLEVCYLDGIEIVGVFEIREQMRNILKNDQVDNLYGHLLFVVESILGLSIINDNNVNFNPLMLARYIDIMGMKSNAELDREFITSLLKVCFSKTKYQYGSSI